MARFSFSHLRLLGLAHWGRKEPFRSCAVQSRAPCWVKNSRMPSRTRASHGHASRGHGARKYKSSAQSALVVAGIVVRLATHPPAAAFVWPTLQSSPPCGGFFILHGDSGTVSPRPRGRRLRLTDASGLPLICVFARDGEQRARSRCHKRHRGCGSTVSAGAGPSGAGEVSSPVKNATAPDKKPPEFSFSSLLNAMTSEFSVKPDESRASNDGIEEGELEDVDSGGTAVAVQETGADDPTAVIAASATDTSVAADEMPAEDEGGEEENGTAVPEAVEMEGKGDGRAQERGRRRDMYKIRSLLLQGQIAGLRERLKERELDVKELRVLTGGRGQSKLRELGAMLKDARAECDRLREREQALAQELAMSQKEGDTLRGDLLTNQKALADLNAYADSLRSRYTAEMVKLEASLAEMERELTRAEAAHMRERRELLDREASAVAEGQRFMNRTFLLQEEVVKTRAREVNLRRENARLLETSVLAKEEQDAAASTPPIAAAAGAREQGAQANDDEARQALQSLQKDNAELRSKLERLSSSTESDSKRERASGPAERSTAEPEESGEEATVAESGTTELLSSRSWARGSGGIGRGGPAAFVNPFVRGGLLPGTVPGMVPEGDVLDAEVNSGSSSVNDDGREPSLVGKKEPVDQTSTTVANVTREAGFPSVDEAERVFREAGVARVVEGLRAENARLRQRLRAAEKAADVEEKRANEETDRADRLETELGRVKITVKGRVRALKAALEEAEGDAARAQLEKEEFVAQWGEDVDALRQQIEGERTRRREERKELDVVIVDLEHELEDLKERYRQLKSSAKRKRSQGGSEKRHKGSVEKEVAPKATVETPVAREDESYQTSVPTRSADEEWRQAMTLLQRLE